jgi:hypothetical protein
MTPFDEIREADPEAEGLRVDQLALQQVIARYAGLPEAPRHAVAAMLGQSSRAVDPGPLDRLLRDENRAGRLRYAADAKSVPYGGERVARRNPHSVPIAAGDLRAWILEHGRQFIGTAGAKWAGIHETESEA